MGIWDLKSGKKRKRGKRSKSGFRIYFMMSKRKRLFIHYFRNLQYEKEIGLCVSSIHKIDDDENLLLFYNKKKLYFSNLSEYCVQLNHQKIEQGRTQEIIGCTTNVIKINELNLIVYLIRPSGKIRQNNNICEHENNKKQKKNDQESQETIPIDNETNSQQRSDISNSQNIGHTQDTNNSQNTCNGCDINSGLQIRSVSNNYSPLQTRNQRKKRK